MKKEELLRYEELERKHLGDFDKKTGIYYEDENGCNDENVKAVEEFGSLELNRIYQMECIEGMRLIPSKSIDMILCDLPYGTTDCKWDTIIPFEPLWEQYERVIKDNGAIILSASQPFTSKLLISKLDLFRYEIIWEKEQATNFMFLKKQVGKIHENILVFYKKQPTYNPQMTQTKKKSQSGSKNKIQSHILSGGSPKREGATDRFPTSIIKFNRDRTKLHPTQKPVSLFEFLIKTYTNEGEIVLDNCMGSGTSAVAALRTNRNFIGFERESEYVEIANQRLESVVRGEGLTKEDA
jgi:site-specific DNA-methyltransferase (adenine-specific)